MLLEITATMNGIPVYDDGCLDGVDNDGSVDYELRRMMQWQ